MSAFMTKGKKAMQLPLHLPLEVASAREDLVVTNANREAVSYLDNWPEPMSDSSIGSIAILSRAGGRRKKPIWQIFGRLALARNF